MLRSSFGRRCAALVSLACAASGLFPAGVAYAAGPERRGTLAVLNLGQGGHLVVQRAQKSLGELLGGWARQPGIAEFLAAQPNPGSLPTGDTGRDLQLLVERVRATRQPASHDLFRLGQLLAVDYLLLLVVRKHTLSARLFSVHRQSYAPQGFEGADQRVEPLRGYLEAQLRQPEPVAKRWKRRWWLLAAVAGVAALTIGLALGTGDGSSGDLKIVVHR